MEGRGMPGPIQPPEFVRRVPEGDTRERDVCGACGFVHFVNPKIVAGSVVRHGGRFLLCKRAIEPRPGYWTLPAGYMECGESAEDAARREAREEANAEIVIERLLAVYSVPRISQVQLLYLAHLGAPDFSPGIESLETRLFDWEGIPWGDLAFPSVRWALHHARRVEGMESFAPFTNNGDEAPASGA
jgi:ADP-ribose pyrophosphatase YjhB (NUDIX family)